MDLNFSIIKSISNIYDEMKSQGFSLVYMGEFSHEITKAFTTMTENDMERNNEDRSVQRKVFHVMVETLQNLNSYSDEATGNVGKGLFAIGHRGDIYHVITSNRVNASQRLLLEEILERINSATPEELKAMYKEQMKNEPHPKEGSSLGLIDIARKTGQKLEYQFLPLEPNIYFFILRAEISAKRLPTGPLD